MKDNHKYIIKQTILNKNDPDNAIASADNFNKFVDNKVCIGYIIKNVNDKVVINMYLIDERYAKGKTYNYDQLLNGLIEYIETKKLVFRNPSIDNWIETKENWCFKMAHKLSTKYNLDYDDVLSLVFVAITKVFNKAHVYVGNLAYIARSAENEVLMYFRATRNRLNNEHPLVTSLDEVTNEDGDKETTLHEIIGQEDDFYKEQEFEESKARIIHDMSFVFSAREIEQIIENRGQLPRNLYLRLLKWRKQHKRGDYDV
jgi:hypothetical protein